MHPQTVEEVVKDFKGRRAGIIKALTKDVEKFCEACGSRDSNLCLYGLPNHQWEVNPTRNWELPEPRLGINFARDAMQKEEWLSMVALHSDAWLHAVASYFASKFKFGKADRKRLFCKITNVPSICDAMTSGDAKKRAKTRSGDFPEEMLVEVLARLPVKDLLRYKCVCKTWCKLIDNPEFISTHLNKYKSNSEGNHLLLIMEEPPTSFKRKPYVRRSNTYREIMELACSIQGLCHVSYINGVILLRHKNLADSSEIILWNPSINRFRNITMLQAMREASYCEFGLGFDASCNDYKVIAIIYPHANNTYTGLVQVYTLSTNSWRIVGVDPPPYRSVHEPQVFFKGAIHWTTLGPDISDDESDDMEDSHVVSFDVGTEVFNYFELPSYIYDDDGDDDYLMKKFLTVMEGSLALFCTRDSSYHNIWVMEEYGMSDSWTKRYSFKLPTYNLLYFKLPTYNLLYFKSNEELLVSRTQPGRLKGFRGISSYDVKRKCVRNISNVYCQSSKYTIYTYVESLVLLDGANEQPLY